MAEDGSKTEKGKYLVRWNFPPMSYIEVNFEGLVNGEKAMLLEIIVGSLSKLEHKSNCFEE